MLTFSNPTPERLESRRESETSVNLISECGNIQIMCEKMVIKFLLQDKKWQRLQSQQKDILQQKKVVAGKNLPYVCMCLCVSSCFFFMHECLFEYVCVYVCLCLRCLCLWLFMRACVSFFAWLSAYLIKKNKNKLNYSELLSYIE